MARTIRENIAHLLERAGFGASPAEIDFYTGLGYPAAVDLIVNYEQVADDVDSFIGKPGYALVTAANQMANYHPDYDLTSARVRWLFRMLYTKRPLQEKMALFWHNHFATGWTKIAGLIQQPEATRLMAAVPAEDAAKQLGQIELFRAMALGNFLDLLTAVTRDPAMLYWLDGRLNVKATPQENYGREVMELFTFGLTYTEPDVKAAARVFTGWNLQAEQVSTLTIGTQTYPLRQYNFFYNARQHDTGAKTFSFPIYPDGTKTIPARTATAGVQDGLDFLSALVVQPGTATRLATKLYQFFVNDITPPDPNAVATIAGWLTSTNFDMRKVMGQLFMSDIFLDDANFASRYKWPVDVVIGTLKALGPGTLPLQSYLSYLSQMGELLFDPPNVAGYKAGPTWINSGTMLARANFGSVLTSNRIGDLMAVMTPLHLQVDPPGIVDYLLAQMGVTQPDPDVRALLIQYVTAGVGNPWKGSMSQFQAKVSGIVHMIIGTGDFAFV